jgi:hypothetical protein
VATLHAKSRNAMSFIAPPSRTAKDLGDDVGGQAKHQPLQAAFASMSSSENSGMREQHIRLSGAQAMRIQGIRQTPCLKWASEHSKYRSRQGFSLARGKPLY